MDDGGRDQETTFEGFGKYQSVGRKETVREKVVVWCSDTTVLSAVLLRCKKNSFWITLMFNTYIRKGTVDFC